MPALLGPDDAKSLTEPYHAVWAAAHRHAWALWLDRLLNDPEFFKPLTSAERYAILHRHITDYAERHLDGVSGVVTPRNLDFFAQVIGDQALVRFKHVDHELRPRSYPTDQQQHLDRQEFTDRILGQLSLDGIAAPLTVLTVGYTLTLGEDELGRILIVCRTPEPYYWYPITGDAGEQDGGADILSFPGFEPPGPRVVSARRKDAASEDEVE